MADVKISQLPAASTPLAGTEQIPLVQDSTTKQITVSNLLTSANLGTPSAINLANATNVPMAQASGTLAVANGGTGTATPALVAGTNVTISGSWPNQTINSTYSGAVTSVTGTAPVVSSGGTTPAISMAAATGSVNGYLTSTDWTTFNNKLTSGGALGTPSSGTATNLTGLPLSTGVTGLLPVANGGTGTATPALVAGSNVTISGTWPNQTIAAAGAAQVYPGAGIANSTGSAWGTSYSTTGSGTVLALATSPTFVTPALGTPASGDFSTGTFTWPTFNQNTSGTAAGLSATLAVASGGTGQTSYTDGQLLIGNSTGNTLTKATLTAGANITITNSAGGITIAATGGGGSGTVTSVSGTGTVNGLTLTGTVTTSGSLTLGGTLDLSSPPAIGGTTAAAITGTVVTATTKVVTPYVDAVGSGGGQLRNASGTSQLAWGAGGGSNLTLEVATNINPANAAVSIAPTGTGTVTINPATAGTINNMSIGATTPTTGAFTSLTTTGTINLLTVGRGAGAVSSNTAVGASALAGNSTAAYQTSLGYQALYTGGGGTDTAVGALALYAANSSGGDNTAVGYASGTAITSGAYNTAIGKRSLQATTTGNYNVGLGHSALYSNTTASNNTAVGYQAGYLNTAGFNTFIGNQAGYSLNTTGDTVNCFVGSTAGYGTTTGSANTFVGGSSTGAANTTGSYNVALGNQALRFNTTASNNTAVGYQAGYTNTTGAVTAFGYQAAYTANAGKTTAIGRNSLFALTSGTDNTAVGQDTASTLTTGASNVAMGVGAFYAGTTGSYNVALGNEALRFNTTASNNTAVGYQAGYSTTGANNTFLGNIAGYNATTGSSNIFIGYNATPAAVGDSGELVIGVNTTGKGSNTGYIVGNGSIYQGNNSSSWATTSDQRLKKNIVDNNVGLEKITAIQVRNFEYRTEEEVTELPTHSVIKKEGVQLGVIAQELQAILPECVKQESTGVLSVDTDNLTWYLINAVKQLSARVQQLEGNV